MKNIVLIAAGHHYDIDTVERLHIGVYVLDKNCDVVYYKAGKGELCNTEIVVQ